MEHYEQELENNIVELERIRRQLSGDVHALRTDPERVRIEARTVGYYLPDERIVRIAGYRPPVPSSSPGRLLILRPSTSDQRPLFRSIALCIGLGYLLLSTIVRHIKKR